jgi:hypothetical protein
MRNLGVSLPQVANGGFESVISEPRAPASGRVLPVVVQFPVSTQCGLRRAAALCVHDFASNKILPLNMYGASSRQSRIQYDQNSSTSTFRGRALMGITSKSISPSIDSPGAIAIGFGGLAILGIMA